MLRRLQDMPTFRVAEGSPDICGWKVTDRDGGVVGKVDSLLVETDEKGPEGMVPVRYMTVASRGRTFLVPIGTVNLRDSDQVVELQASFDEIERMPDYQAAETTAERERHYFTTFFPHEKEPNYQRPEFEHRSNRLKQMVESFREGREHRTEAHEGPRAQPRGRAEAVERGRRSDVEFERRPVHKPLAETEFGETGGRAIEDEDTLRVPIIGEETVVHKVPFVEEEIVLHTRDRKPREHARQEAEFVSAEPSESERMRRPTQATPEGLLGRNDPLNRPRRGEE